MNGILLLVIAVQVGLSFIALAFFYARKSFRPNIKYAAAPAADGSGARVAPGVYIWRVEVGPASAAKKCVVN